MKPKVVSIGYALPERSYTQAELFDMLGYKSARVRSIFANAGISRRHLCVNPVGKDWQELTVIYQKSAIELSKRAVLECLDGRSVDQIGCVVFSSCTGYSCPGISHHLAKELDMPDDLIHANLLGMGCEASSPSLSRAVDYLVVHNKPALMVSCEICSCAYYPGRESDMENTVANALFGDAAAAVLVDYDSVTHHPEIVDMRSYFDKDYLGYLGFKWADGRLKCVLHKDVPRASSRLVKEAVDRTLAANGLTIDKIDHWAVHPGGVSVLEAIQKSLGLSYEQVRLSYEVLQEMGNVSSATVIIIGKSLNRVQSPAWGMAVTMGAGFEVGTCLLRW